MSNSDLVVTTFEIKWVPIEKYNELVKHVLELEEKLSKRIEVLEKGAFPHQCPEWDYLFISPGSPEFDSCTCFKKVPDEK